MDWHKRLADLFNVRPGEGHLVLLMMVSSAATGISINYYFTASSALFLAQYEVSALPYTILATGFALFATQFLYQRAAARLSPNRLLVWSLVSVIALLALIRVSLALTDAKWLAFVILVLFRVMIIVLIVGFWSLANRLLTLGQSKRLFSLISAGDVISIMIGSFLVPVIVGAIGIENLFVIVLGSIVINLASVLAIQRAYHTQLAASEAPPVAASSSSAPAKKPTSALRHRYVQLIFALYILAWTSNYALDYTFLGQLQARYASTPEKIASFIGVLFGIIQMTNFVLKFFLSGRLLSRYGLRFGLLMLPVVFTVGVLMSVSAGVIAGTGLLFFWLIVVTKYGEEVLRESFNEPSTRILYQPMPLQQRAFTLGLVEGTGFPLTALIAGSLLVTFTITGTYTALRIALVMLALGAMWVVLALTTYRRYVDALRHALTNRIFRGDQLLTTDATMLQQLAAKLDSPRPDEVIYALNLLEELDPAFARQHWTHLLSSPAPEVRTSILERMERAPLPLEAAPACALVESDPSPAVREAALRACLALDPSSTAFAELYLDRALPEVRRGALVGLLRYTGTEGVALAEQRLSTLASSSDPEDRVLAAQVLGEAADARLEPHLAPLLCDPDDRVLRAALTAMSQARYPALWPLVVDALANAKVRAAALQAIVAGGPASLEEVGRRLWLPETPRAARLWLLKACGRIGGPAAIALLEGKLDWPDATVRTHLLKALSAAGYRASDAGAETVRARVAAEAASATALLAHGVALGSQADGGLLTAALREEFAASRQRLLLLLSFLYDSRTILRAQQAFQRGGEVEQSYALEVLDIAITKDLRRFIRPLFDALTDEQRVAQLVDVASLPDLTPEQRLRALSVDEGVSPWLRAVAAHTLGRTRPDAHADALWLALSQSPEPIVQQVAGEVLAHDEEPTMLSTIEKVIILKTVRIFSQIPDGALAELANIVEEESFAAGETIITKGDLGSSMYIIVSGKVRAHDGQVVFNTLGERDVFGEMAVLDPEPRVASITAEEETLVFRLDQQPFYEVMADYPEISQAVIRVIIRYLRDRVRDVARLTAQFEELQQDGQSAARDVSLAS